jgi:flagellar biosynthesis protein FlhG
MKKIGLVGAKGGVGTTTLSILMAIAFSRVGKKPILVDLDSKRGDLEYILNPSNNYSVLIDYLNGSVSLEKLRFETGLGFQCIFGSSEVHSFRIIREIKLFRHLESMISCKCDLENPWDVVIVDYGSKLNSDDLELLPLVDELIVVSTADHVGVTTAYQTIKMVHSSDIQLKLSLVLNKVRSEKEADECHHALDLVNQKYMGRSVGYAGFICDDPLFLNPNYNQSEFIGELHKSQIYQDTFTIVNSAF